jgi:putative transposase
MISIPPKYSTSIMGFLKGKLSIRLFQKYERIGKKFWGWHYLWSRGYCVSTVGLDEERIRKYVTWQEQREKEIEKQQLNLFE